MISNKPISSTCWTVLREKEIPLEFEKPYQISYVAEIFIFVDKFFHTNLFHYTAIINLIVLLLHNVDK